MPKPIVIIHGGAGMIASLSPEVEAACRTALADIARNGYRRLQDGQEAVAVVRECIVELENFPHFNAGIGAVFTDSGKHDLDAGIMSGHDLKVGGVSVVQHVKNPILLADKVRSETKFSLFAGPGADALATKYGLETVPNSYFDTVLRGNQLESILARRKAANDPTLTALDYDTTKTQTQNLPKPEPPRKLPRTETVGAVALDRDGKLAAGSSTGGQTAKPDGRCLWLVYHLRWWTISRSSDSSMAGCGFWADSRVAVTGTGDGDWFIRASSCSRIADRYSRSTNISSDTLEKLCNEMVHSDMPPETAGIVAVDALGNFCMPYNTKGFFRSYFYEGMEKPYVAIWDY